jgi:hypothetical protein
MKETYHTAIATSQVKLSHCAKAAAVAVGVGTVHVVTDGMVNFGKLESSDLVHPVLLVSSVGHWTWVKLKVGLSEFLNQSNLQLHPDCSFVGIAAHWDLLDMPPYCAPGMPPN